MTITKAITKAKVSRLMALALHPAALFVYFMLNLYVANQEAVSLSELISTGVFLAVIGLFTWVVIWHAIRSALRASIVISVWVILFFTFGHAYELVQPWLVPSGAGPGADELEVTRLNWLLGGIWVVLILATPLLAERISERSSLNICKFLSLFGTLLLAFPLAGLSYAAVSNFVSESPTIATLPDAGEHHTGAPNPDLIVIFLDSYARADTLSKRFEFDNTEFIEELQNRGFMVLGNSRSNYPWSQLSLPSFMQLDYLQSMPGWPDPDEGNKRFLQEAFSEARLVRKLKDRGLRYHHFESSYFVSNRSRQSDVHHSCTEGTHGAMERLLYQTTLARLWNSALVQSLAHCHLKQFDKLAAVASQSGPKFLFAHFLPPHHPYLFDRTGRILREASISEQFRAQLSQWADKAAYIEQLQFINKKVLGVIDDIQAHAVRPYIMMLASDHGPKLIGPGLQRQVDYTDHRFRNFIAVLEPGKKPSIPDRISLVNFPRKVLNDYYGTELPALEDRFFEAEFHTPYNLHEISFPEFE